MVADSITTGEQVGFKFDKKLEFPLPTKVYLSDGEKIEEENSETVILFKK